MFNRWVDSGECYLQRGGIKPFDKIVAPENYDGCLEEFLETDQGHPQKSRLLFSHELGHPDRKMTGFYIVVRTK